MSDEINCEIADRGRRFLFICKKRVVKLQKVV